MKSEHSVFIPEVHSEFTINQKLMTVENLKFMAYEFQKNGEPYEQEAGSFLLDWLQDKEYITVQTSGSTGKPKQIKVSKQAMINSALATGKFFKIQEGTTALHCLSSSYIAGKMMWVRAMILGWKIDMVPPRTNPLDSVYRQYDFCAMVPMQLDNSLNRLHLLKKLIVGGGRVSGHLKYLVRDSKTKIFETYGMTETLSHIAAKRINSKKNTKEEETIFKVLPNIEIKTDERDCLVIHAPLLQDKEIVTNDVVSLITPKKFILKGRIDNVVNSGGIKLFPEEIEKKLQLFMSYSYFLAGIPDKTLGEKLILIIEKTEDTADKENFLYIVKNVKTLSKYEIPKEVFFLPQFLRTESGKIQRSKTLKLLPEK